MNPEFLAADEPVASLDVSIQAQIINLFRRLQRERGFTLLFIAHDLTLVRYLCDRVGVMYRGRLIESAASEELFENPLHPYTKSLLSAVPRPDPLIERKRKLQIYEPQEDIRGGVLKEYSPGALRTLSLSERIGLRKVLQYPIKSVKRKAEKQHLRTRILRHLPFSYNDYSSRQNQNGGEKNVRKNILLYFLKKLLIFAASIFLLSIAVFCISRLSPGDPLVSYYGDQAERMSPQQRELAEERLGLNDPLIVQYEHWLTGALQGDFGISFKYKTDVLEVIGSRLGNTLILGGTGFILIFTLALLLGILCAWFEDRWPTGSSVEWGR